LKLIDEIKPQSVLEIGPGRNIIKNIIKNETKYFSLDIDPSLKPDILGNIFETPIKEKSFDAVLCFQVLEHFPYDNFSEALQILSRLTKDYVLLGLPYANHEFSIKIKAPVLGERKLRILIPKFYRTHKFDGQHYWEIGKKDFPLKKIIGDISEVFSIEKYFTPFEFNYHTFFVLRKRK